MSKWKTIFLKCAKIPRNLAARIYHAVRSRFWYWSQRRRFCTAASKTRTRFFMARGTDYPIYNEATANTGFDRHYVYHTAWAARIVAQTRPKAHTDISSSLYFAAIVSAFCPIFFFDYRPPKLALEGLTTESCDLLKLPFEDSSLESLSCMHVIEHVGLGRYGDPIDYDGDLKAIAELRRVIKPKGSLLFVVPIGQPEIHFNAHRIYSYRQVIESFPDFELLQFALIPDSDREGGLAIDPSESLADAQRYGCGCFWFRKK